MEQGAEKSAIQRLFEKARKAGGFEYLYALVRIDGMQCYDGYKDELVSLVDWLRKPEITDMVEAYRGFSEQPGPLDLLQNLLNVANGKHYQVRAFIHLKKGTGFNATWPTVLEKIQALVENAKASGLPELGEQIAAAYQLASLETNQPPDNDVLKTTLSKLTGFLKELLDCYFSERIEFSKGLRYIK